MTDDNRDAAGRWKQGGPSPNPGGMTRTQARIMRALEGMSEAAAHRLWELMHSSDEKISLGAVAEYFKRMAPPPSKEAQPARNTNADDAGSLLVALKARAAARKAAETIDVTPVAPTTSALPAPDGDAGASTIEAEQTP